MTTLAVDTPRNMSGSVDPLFEELDVIASDIIYWGAAVGANTSGIMRPLVAGDRFMGFCEGQADNSLGAASDIRVKLRRQGIAQLTVTGATAASDNGLPVYASDDNAFTLTPTGSPIGTIAKWITSTTCLVYFVAEQLIPRRRPRLVTKTGDYSVVAADEGTEFDNLGAAGTVIFTLPAASDKLLGFRVTFRAITAAQLLRVSCTAGQMMTFNNAAATSVTYGTGSEIIGGEFVATCISTTKWFISIRAEETQTVTVA